MSINIENKHLVGYHVTPAVAKPSVIARPCKGRGNPFFHSMRILYLITMSYGSLFASMEDIDVPQPIGYIPPETYSFSSYNLSEPSLFAQANFISASLVEPSSTIAPQTGKAQSYDEELDESSSSGFEESNEEATAAKPAVAKPKPLNLKRKKVQSADEEYEVSSDKESATDHIDEGGKPPAKKKTWVWEMKHREEMYEITEKTKDVCKAIDLFTAKFEDITDCEDRIKALAYYCMSKNKPVNIRESWNKDESDIIYREYDKNPAITAKEILKAKIPGLTKNEAQIYNKLKKISASIKRAADSSSAAKRTQQRWTTKENKIICKAYKEGKTAKEVLDSDKLPNRTLAQIVNKLAYLKFWEK